MSTTKWIFTLQSHPTSTAHRTSSASLLYGPPHFYGAIKTAKTIITPKGRKGRHLFIVRPQWGSPKSSWLYRAGLEPKNSCLFEFPAFLLPTNFGQLIQSPSALTEHGSLNLAGILPLDPVLMSCIIVMVMGSQSIIFLWTSSLYHPEGRRLHTRKRA